MQPREAIESLYTPDFLRRENKTKKKKRRGRKIKTEQWKTKHWRRQLQVITLWKHPTGKQHMLEEPSLGTQDPRAGGCPGKPAASKRHMPGQVQSSSSSGELSLMMPRDENILVLKTKNPFLLLPIAPGNKQQARG